MSGRDAANQHIKQWWDNLRKDCGHYRTNCWYVILKVSDDFDGGFVDKNLVQICFLLVFFLIA